MCLGRDAGLGAWTRPSPVGTMPWPEGHLCHLMTLRLGTGSPVQHHEAIRGYNRDRGLNGNS